MDSNKVNDGKNRRLKNLLPPIQKGEHRGRKKGTPNVMTRVLKEAIILAGENIGNKLADMSKEERKGLVSYFEWAAEKHPAAFLGLLGRIMPMQVEKTEKEIDVPYKTVEEVKQALRDRGLPVERIYPMLEFEPIKRDDVEVPE